MLQNIALKLKHQIYQHGTNSKQRHTPRNLKEEAELNPLICSHHHFLMGVKKVDKKKNKFIYLFFQ